jgi:hypothetical protein
VNSGALANTRKLVGMNVIEKADSHRPAEKVPHLIKDKPWLPAQPNPRKSLFDDSDDDMVPIPKKVAIEKPKDQKPMVPCKKKLFDDSDDDNELFQTSPLRNKPTDRK